MLERLITASIISSKILKIYDEKLDRFVRPTLNIFIRKPFGFGFSTMAMELEEKGYVNFINEFSVPGIIGSVKGSKIYKGALARSGYKLTIFDEVMMLDKKSKKVVLELSEHGTATRSIQGFVEKRSEVKIEGGRYVVEEGKLILRVHTSFIFGTASDDILNDPDLKMLLSRCFCINLTLDFEEAIRLKKEGRKIIVNEKIIPKEPIEKVILPSEMNDKILEMMEYNAIVEQSDGGYYTRCHDDLIRLSAVHCVARNDRTINEKDIKFAMQFYKLHQIGYLGSVLSETALRIYSIADGNKISDIAKKLNISERTVRKYIRNLEELGLIVKINNRIYKAIQ